MPRHRKKQAKAPVTPPLISEGIREQYFFLPITVIFAAIVYYRTLCPTVFVGDSGELATASYFLGIPHSPGYPLYCLLGWVFTHLPIAGDVAYKLNLMSAFFAVGTVLVLYLIIYHFTRTPYISFSISLAYAFSPIFWSQATVAEVYTLNTFLTALSLYFLCRWLEKRADYWIYIAFLTMGLAFANHELAFLLLPTGLYLLWLFGKDFKSKGNRFLLIIAGLYIFGLLFYLYLPIQALADPPINWGDPDTFSKFIRAVITPAGSQISRGSRFVHFWHALYLWTIQFSPVFAVGNTMIPIPIIWAFGIWGIFKGLKTGWRMARIFIFFMLANFLIIIFVSKPTSQELMIVGVYYLPTFLVFSVFMATGLREWLQQYTQRFTKQRTIILGLIILIIVLIPEYQLFQNYPQANRSDDYYAKDYGTTLLNACPKDSILLCNWDDIFTLWYLQKVENVRADVIPVLTDFPVGKEKNYWGRWYFDELDRKHPEIFQGFDIDQNFFSGEEAINAFVMANLSRKRKVCFSYYGLGYDFGNFDFPVLPMAQIYRAGGRNYDYSDLVKSRDSWERTIKNFRHIYDYYEHQTDEEDFLISRLSMNLRYTAVVAKNLDRKYAKWFYNQALKVDTRNPSIALELALLYFDDKENNKARELLLQAAENDPYDPRIFYYLALLYERAGEVDLAKKNVETALMLDPNYPDARGALERLKKAN